MEKFLRFLVKYTCIVMGGTVVAIILALLPGCTPYYASEAKYMAGENIWWGDTYSMSAAMQNKAAYKMTEGEIAAINQEDSSLIRVINGVNCFKVVIANMADYSRYNFKISAVNGSYNKSVYLGPGQRTVIYLPGGKYKCSCFYGGSLQGWGEMDISTITKDFYGEKCFGYFTAEF